MKKDFVYICFGMVLIAIIFYILGSRDLSQVKTENLSSSNLKNNSITKSDNINDAKIKQQNFENNQDCFKYRKVWEDKLKEGELQFGYTTTFILELFYSPKINKCMIIYKESFSNNNVTIKDPELFYNAYLADVFGGYEYVTFSGQGESVGIEGKKYNFNSPSEAKLFFDKTVNSFR